MYKLERFLSFLWLELLVIRICISCFNQATSIIKSEQYTEKLDYNKMYDILKVVFNKISKDKQEILSTTFEIMDPEEKPINC